MAVVSSEYVDIDPAVCGGRPRIRGTRIRVQDIVVEHLHHGLCPEEIVNEFPRVTLSGVYAALSYYFDHLDEIRKALDYDRALYEKGKAEAPSLLGQRSK